MVNTREVAVKNALHSTTNVPRTCQLWTRTQYDAPSAGDVDLDGDADAVDGWLSEPYNLRHPGDRKPPVGVPVAWSGGSSGNGHRAIVVAPGMIRSTDAAGSGRVGTVPLDWVERNWGLHYLGWSESIDGILIPDGTPSPPPTRGRRVDKALRNIRKSKAKPGTLPSQ